MTHYTTQKTLKTHQIYRLSLTKLQKQVCLNTGNTLNKGDTVRIFIVTLSFFSLFFMEAGATTVRESVQQREAAWKLLTILADLPDNLERQQHRATARY